MADYDNPTPGMLANADQNIATGHAIIRKLAAYARTQPDGWYGFRAVGLAVADTVAVTAAMYGKDLEGELMGLLTAAVIQLGQREAPDE